MAYKVKVSKPAQADAREYADFIRLERQSPSATSKWLDGLKGAIAELKQDALLYNVIDDFPSTTIEYRCKLYHSHRIIFYLDQASKTVYIVRIYHGSRQPLKPHNLQDFDL